MSILSAKMLESLPLDMARLAEGRSGPTLLLGDGELLAWLLVRPGPIEWLPPPSATLAPALEGMGVERVDRPRGGPYDTVILNDCLDRPPQIEPWLAEMAALVRPGGRLLMRLPRGVPLLAGRSRALLAGRLEGILRSVSAGEWHPLPPMTPGWILAAWVVAGEAIPPPALPPLPEEGTTPHVTILMATRDRAALLKEAIASLAAQTLSDWQAVIVDDGSTDGSAAFLERLAARDHRYTILGGEGRGKGEALARALPEARGELLLILDDDDRLAPRMLELASAALERASGGSGDPPEAGAVVTDAVIIDERGAIRGVRSTPAVHPRSMGRALLEGCYLLQPTVLLRRREVEAAGGFRRELRRLQDYDLWWRLAGRIDWIHLPLPLAQVRTHGGNRKDPRLRGEIAAAAQGILRRVRKEVPLEELFPDLAEASDERERLRVETEARFELARALLRLRLFGEAVEEMRAIIERTAETVPVTCLLARALLGAGEREEAERLFGSILAGNPGDGNALNGLGLCRAGAGDWDGAERHFRRALQAAPSHLVSRVNWLHARMGGEMPAEVADFHRGVIAREDPPGVEYLILEIEQGVRDGDEAGAGS